VSPHSKVKKSFVFNFPKHEDLAQIRYTRVILDNKNTLCSFLDSMYVAFFRVLMRISGQMKEQISGDDQ